MLRQRVLRPYLRGFLTGLSGPVAGVAFSPDGRTLASANKRVVTLWNTDTETLPHILCSMAGRDLFKDEWVEILPDKNYRKVCA
jgi:WD40 repeat protein